MSAPYKHSNPGWSGKLKKLLAGRQVAVGFPRGDPGGGKIYPTGASVLQVAVWNNFGAPKLHIPARPFMQQAVGPVKRATSDLVKRILRTMCRRGTPFTREELDKLCPLMGQEAKAQIMDTITNGHFLPNAPSTIRRKGSSHPLIDTTLMRASVAYAVRKPA